MAYRVFKEVSSEAFLGRISTAVFKRHASSAAAEAAKQVTEISAFRTSENNPVQHNHTHAGRYYTISEDVMRQVYHHGGFTKAYQKQIKTFNESCLMVRNSTLELLQYLKSADYSRPAVRYVIYGENGCGKTIALAHVLHFGYVSEFILVHVPLVHMWLRNCKEVSNSATREGFVDLNLDAAAWLVHFKFQNTLLMKKLDLRLSRKYEWSKREETEGGVPLMDLVEFGIKRIKYASECVIALIQEIKTHSTEGRCKTLVAIDGFNAFFYPRTHVITEAKVRVPPWKITLTQAFLEITTYDWCNGAVVVTVGKRHLPPDRHESSLPLYLLGKKGFEHLDPFVPIKISEYDENELESCLEYYIDRRWLQNKKGCTEEGKTELKYLSGMNPRRLMEICAPL